MHSWVTDTRVKCLFVTEIPEPEFAEKILKEAQASPKKTTLSKPSTAFSRRTDRRKLQYEEEQKEAE